MLLGGRYNLSAKPKEIPCYQSKFILSYKHKFFPLWSYLWLTHKLTQISHQTPPLFSPIIEGFSISNNYLLYLHILVYCHEQPRRTTAHQLDLSFVWMYFKCVLLSPFHLQLQEYKYPIDFFFSLLNLFFHMPLDQHFCWSSTSFSLFLPAPLNHFCLPNTAALPVSPTLTFTGCKHSS